jgi:nitrate reductase cytochrome c-type subunit
MKCRLILLCAVLLIGCDQAERSASSVPVPGEQGREKSTATVRAARRLFDGAPPVIPHQNFNIRCTQCHQQRGLEVPGIGFAPPAPHENTLPPGPFSRCNQCHIFKQTDKMFVDNSFEPLRQDLRAGRRLNELAPPVIPHMVFMRENCFACHDGPAAREEIRTPHPERTNCRQCHVETMADTQFVAP